VEYRFEEHITALTQTNKVVDVAFSSDHAERFDLVGSAEA